MRESELVARRVVLWAVAGVGVSLSFGYLGVGFRSQDTLAIFSAKLALLGLVVAAGTFQYGAGRRSTGGSTKDFVDLLRYNRIALGNYVFIGLALLLSCGLDGLGLLATDVAGWRHVSTALLAVTAAPFGETLVRYLGAMGLEFDAARREFAAALRRARLDDRAPTR
jgi:hypothetical protein